MEKSEREERDLVLAPNEYACILDNTKGNTVVYVGPHKTSLANTDVPVVFDEKTKKFTRTNLEKAKQCFATAPEGWYLILKNPAKETAEGEPMPNSGANSLPSLDVGKKVIIPGPCSRPLWPGQMAKVVQGHHLRSNQYLLIKVYDEKAANENWKTSIIKKQVEKVDKKPVKGAEEGALTVQGTEFTMGQLMVVKGTDVSFFVPPTGIQVIKTTKGKYTRKAITLERLEYCILKDENGNKRFLRGPAVVFPKPTEGPVTDKNGMLKFKAIELNEISGIYLKVIADYTDGKKEYKVGDELFITGKDQMIYFPREEHATIRYGDNAIHYAVAIPAGEARYVLDRMTGEILLKRGPCMFLPDPRKYLIVRRVLDSKTVELWYPGNQEAMEYNLTLGAITEEQKTSGEPANGDMKYISDRDVRKLLKSAMYSSEVSPDVDDFYSNVGQTNSRAHGSLTKHSGDKFDRKTKFTPPRTITIDTKYEGAPLVNVWTGYAVQVVDKRGNRKVVEGPSPILLEYDESLEAMVLSTGKPKVADNLKRTVYLRVLNNKVSDIISADTSDLCPVDIRVSYRVNFTGDKQKWFSVENYVKFLCDHMRSRLRNVIKRLPIKEFHANSIDIVRDTVLGKHKEKGGRPGMKFDENGMHIYDVEVLAVDIVDNTIREMLVDSQRHVTEQSLALEASRKKLVITEEMEGILRKESEVRTETVLKKIELSTNESSKRHEYDMSLVEHEAEKESRRWKQEVAVQEDVDLIESKKLERQKNADEQSLEISRSRQTLGVEYLEAEAKAAVSRITAVSPGLISALQSFSDKQLAASMAKAMQPIPVVGGESLGDTFNNLIKGTLVENALSNGGNGKAKPKSK